MIIHQPRREQTRTGTAVQPPAFSDAAAKAFIRTPIDHFILDKLRKAELKPAPAADRATLIRRLTNDLHGLPPTPQEVEDFVSDKSAQLAGEEIDPSNQTLLIASGFNRLGPLRKNAGNQEVASSRTEVLTEMTGIVGASMLGVTLGCARCHGRAQRHGEDR